MSSLIPYLRARLQERSSRIQLAVLGLLALGLTGLVTLDQIHAYATQITSALVVLGPLAGLLVPDHNKAVDVAASQDEALAAALAAATAAAERAAGPEATAVAKQIGAVADKLGL